VIIAHGHGIGLDAGRDIEIGIGDDLGLTSRMDQKTRMAVPLDEEIAENEAARTRASPAPACGYL
jgi:hypothetical protein